MTFDNFIAGLHAFLAVVTTFIGVVTMKNRRNIQQIKVSINSRMDELIASVKAQARAEGREEGRNEKL